jgi:tRNA-dihydrouridine synthase B
VQKHLKRAIEWKGNVLGLLETRMHYAAYFKGLDGVKEYRARLVNTLDYQEILEILDEMRDKYGNQALGN